MAIGGTPLGTLVFCSESEPRARKNAIIHGLPNRSIAIDPVEIGMPLGLYAGSEQREKTVLQISHSMANALYTSANAFEKSCCSRTHAATKQNI